eukprot:scaffold560_cov130-Alexandrium_tamarense.AAC.2
MEVATAVIHHEEGSWERREDVLESLTRFLVTSNYLLTRRKSSPHTQTRLAETRDGLQRLTYV